MNNCHVYGFLIMIKNKRICDFFLKYAYSDKSRFFLRRKLPM